LLTWDDERYPARLRQIAGAPPVLYVKGALTAADELALAVVGMRRATSYGREVTARLAGELAEAGLTIVSGLARGIDAYAHEAALRAGGRTLAVLGCGVDVVYPADHRGLAERIAERGQGALVSEYHLGTPPDAPNFPARNRLIAGLSLGVLVTEAPAKSGTSQWHACAALGRPRGRSPGRGLTSTYARIWYTGGVGGAPPTPRRDWAGRGSSPCGAHTPPARWRLPCGRRCLYACLPRPWLV
jgi:DNA protecting protein DprA